MNLTDKDLEAIIDLANSEEIMKEQEPQTIWHEAVHKGQVKRVLAAYERIATP
jgi:hypothetical protein